MSFVLQLVVFLVFVAVMGWVSAYVVEEVIGDE